MRALFSTLILCALFAWTGPTLADSFITQTDCDTLSLDPFQVSIEFWVVNGGGSPMTKFQILPLPQEAPGACVVQDCSAPVGWICDLHRIYRGADFGFLQNYVPIGGEAGPFRVVIGSVPCSYEVRYFTFGLPEWYAEEVATFAPSGPVPTLRGTWGEVKARYR